MTTGAGRGENCEINPWAGPAGLFGLCLGLLAGIAAQWPAAAVALAAIACAFAGCLVVEGLPSAYAGYVHRPRAGGERGVAAWRIATKALGLLAMLALAVAVFRIFPFFRDSRLAADIALLLQPLPILLIGMVSLGYLVLCDRIMEDPDDTLHQIGLAVSMRPFRTDAALFALRGLAIKLFFLTLMWDSSVSGVAALSALAADPPPLTLPVIFAQATKLLFLIDAMLAALGYLATLRLFGWHLRATETSLAGWVSCLVCYPPFSTGLGNGFLVHWKGPDGYAILTEPGLFYVAWNVAITACLVIYVWATVAFGARFSNLTHRGIIRHGPYRFVRHPAYLAKNCAWWLIFLPGFMDSGLTDGLARAVMLACLSAIYWMRATAEERMLSQDPAYRDYCAEVDRRGLKAQLTRLSYSLRPRKRTGL